jgi:hypothetical protein
MLGTVTHPCQEQVWKYFVFYTNAEGCILQRKKIYCWIWMTHIAYSGNTSILSYHLKKNHSEVSTNSQEQHRANKGCLCHKFLQTQARVLIISEAQAKEAHYEIWPWLQEQEVTGTLAHHSGSHLLGILSSFHCG